MKIKEIVKTEDNRRIFLHKEGIFWRAYEYSAFVFFKNLKSYQVKKKFFKILDKKVVYLGFPDGVLEQVLNLCVEKGYEVNNQSETLMVITNLAESDGFKQWKDTIPLTENRPIKNENESLIEKLAAFPLASKTPLEAQQFLYELQNEINGHLR